MRPLPRTMLRQILYVLALLAFVTIASLALGACDNGDVVSADSTDTVVTSETSNPETITSSVETTASSAASTTVASSSGSAAVSTSSEEVLPNGHIKACGIIKEVWSDGGTHKITIDYVDYLTGAEADAAAIADGEISAGEYVDDGYYVRNHNTRLRTFTVSGSAAITLDDRSLPPGDLVPLTWTEFAGFWELSGEEAWVSRSLWWIERDGDTVVRIDQQFQP